ncbi:Polysaccharide pyruvyl transferase [Butyrivibrio fibrisolvens]|uniref:Polysaccharide pyruvyl transferase n=1 Tax=Butyrivibrio fibrisolvens TaxID=831 RepID=A0A1H9UTB4_BUTFI|nr:polysaccharide pyruvyl transferase family protein [Butyrivibrio fibrisolvens]SES12307.1 Polysaccharide pyruvyl transferase [Butyrivibrio fibrisolvens]
MKVGIMSMQRIINYGSFLQSYSLKKNFEALGAETTFVDYVPGDVLVSKKDGKDGKLSKILNKVRSHVLFPRKNNNELMNSYWRDYQKLDSSFYSDVLPLLGVTKEKNYKPELDALVIGSDEVFNCLQANPDVGYSKELFGYDNRAQKLCTYAASFGNTTEDGLRDYGIYDEVKSMIGRFDALSARDKNTYDILNKMYDGYICKNVDPVFLYDYHDEVDNIKVEEDNYIVVYAYAKRFSQKESANIIRFAKKHNKKIICLCAPQEYIEGYKALKPFEILAYVKNADYVITDTFHGSVFSIKYNKRFATFVRNTGASGNNEKLNDLLATFGLSDRSVQNARDLESILDREIDYDNVNSTIDNEVLKGKNYLKSILES